MSESASASRWKFLLPLLLGTVALVAWLELSGDADDAEVVSAVVRPRASAAGEARTVPSPGGSTSASADAERELRIDRVPREASSNASKGDDPFARVDWNPPAPKAPPPAAAAEAAPPPRPVAPPIPYTYFGMSIQDGKTVVFVTRQDRTFVLAAGEVIENRYRVEEIRPTEVVLTYIPLNERQVMTIGTAKP